jgi:mono/diheme cytochrome c family protein
MSLIKIKLAVAALVIAPALALTAMHTAPVGAATVDDAAVTYKAKCAMCHGAAAAKFFDPAKPEEEMVEAILKGKKGEKPPNMPAFEEKGITADQAKELVAYMKQLKAGN